MYIRVLEERMERVLEELEGQKKLVKSQQSELDSVKGEMSRVEVENSKLTKVAQAMSERRQQSDKEKREWLMKCDEAISFAGQLLRERGMGKKVKMTWQRRRQNGRV